MTFETPIGYQNAEKPEDLKNAVFIMQAMLMSNCPLSEEDWVEKYAKTFRRLSETSDEFRDMLILEATPENLRLLQDTLDEENEKPAI